MESKDNEGDWRNQHDALFEHLPVAERSFPLVLVETGFLTNQQDADWLTDLANHEKIATAIVYGLSAYFQGD
jgi:N-acetylmuramoyl-L-alanine amidase